ncbi:MAG TPA: hypothetical protein IAB98_05565 [Candidatus Egerieimonas intestinavium]|uniref:Uncharacterized protein n=1 Tax=Candidatus Egerieimonas intestinavium TaxID=2840777 RepID=A0A9D1EJA4_9FIRM|nr:hypothetical protein [Candidatus Egerieimonas intestinavium]
MTLDNSHYGMIEFVQEEFSRIFQGDIVYHHGTGYTGHMGCFCIEYIYLPLNYRLVFENDRNLFVIDIYDEIGAKTTLFRIVRFENTLNKKI